MPLGATQDLLESTKGPGALEPDKVQVDEGQPGTNIG